MQPSQFKSQGSFGIPEKAKRAMEDMRKEKSAGPAPAVSAPFLNAAEATAPEQDSPLKADLKEDAPVKDAPASGEKSAEEQLKDAKEKLEKRLEAVFSEEELSAYLLKGSVSKEVTIIPEALKGVFRTITANEWQQIDAEMRELMKDSKFTTSGLDNERQMKILAKAWVGIRQKRKSEKWSGEPKPLGKDEAGREQIIRNMGALAVQYASEAWANLNTLLKIIFEEEGVLKK